MTAFLAIAAAAIRDHWAKIAAAVLVAVAVAWLAKCERAEKAADEAKVESGRREVVIEQQERTLQDAQTYRNAVEHRDVGELERVRQTSDRCTRTPAACE
jgi:hypothetical protein